MNVKQVKKDFDNGIMLSRSTIGKLIEHALALEAKVATMETPMEVIQVEPRDE